MELRSLQELIQAQLKLDFVRDESGRPLGEGRCRPDFPKDVELKLVTCPYAGSRYHHEKPMNQSALAGITQYWNEVISLIIEVRERYKSAFGTDGKSVIDHMRLSQILSAIPLYLYLREPLRADKPMPTVVAALFKTIIGAHTAFMGIVIHGLRSGEYSPQAEISPGLMYDVLEQNQNLIGAHEVCAGPPSMIKEFLQAICEGTALQKTEDGILEKLVPDLEEVFRLAGLWRHAAELRVIVNYRAWRRLYCLQSELSRHPKVYAIFKKDITDMFQAMGTIDFGTKKRELAAALKPESGVLWEGAGRPSTGTKYLRAVMRSKRPRVPAAERELLKALPLHQKHKYLTPIFLGHRAKWRQTEQAFCNAVAWLEFKISGRRLNAREKEELGRYVLREFCPGADISPFFARIFDH